MKNIQLLNKIAKVGTDCLDPAVYNIGTEVEAPEGIMVRSAKMHEMTFNKELLAVARAGAGVNNIPVDRCAEEGIVVFNTPGANANGVKELAICALFLASRKIVDGVNWAKGLVGTADVAKQVEAGKSQFGGTEIQGKTLGVIGLGAIGGMVANAAVKLGMKVIGFDPYLSDKAAAMLDKSIVITSKVEEIFTDSDYITVHAPLTDSTKNIVNKDTLAMAKDGIRVLNFARGGLVDDNAIVEAIESGKCAAYATDFPTDAQLGLDGVIALPHLGASTPESEENCAVMAVNQIAEYLEKGNVVNSVNLPCVSKELADGNKRLTVITKGDVSEAVFAALAKAGIAVDDSTAAIRKDAGYVIVDAADITDDALAAVKAVEGVICTRVIG